MKHGKIILFILPLVFFIQSDIFAQQNEILDSLQVKVNPYGSFRGHFAFFNKEVEFQENASRIGLQLGIVRKKFEFFFGAELGINLFKSNSQFNFDGNNASGFFIVQNDQANQVFNTRLGYLGLKMGKYGTISVGKQWSVFYDVTSYTDNFNVFGARGSSTFVAGTDGGASGTGRADQALIYRNEFGPLLLGLQLQAKNTFNNNFVDGFGGSLQWQIAEMLKAGVSFNRSYVNEELVEELNILGYNNDHVYYAAGISYDNKGLLLSAIYTQHENGDLTRGFRDPNLEDGLGPTIVFDAYGFEFFARYNWKKFGVLAGYNHYEPDLAEIERIAGGLPLNDRFKTQDAILGFEYRPSRFTFIYSEFRFANSEDAIGVADEDVFTIGIKIQADRIFNKTISLN